jgi:PAS domain S-box-containing protein
MSHIETSSIDAKAERNAGAINGIRPSLKKKILVPLLLVVSAVLAVTAIEHIVSFQGRLKMELQKRAEHIADFIRFSADSSREPSEFQRLVEDLGGEEQVDLIAVVAGNPARVVASSRPAMVGKRLAELHDAEVSEELSMALDLPSGASRFDQEGDGFDYFRKLSVKSGASSGKESQRAALLISLDTRPIRREILELIVKDFVGDTIVILLLGATCWVLFDRHVLRPMKQIEDAVTGFRRGHAMRIADRTISSREFAELTGAWNSLLDRLEQEELALRESQMRFLEMAENIEEVFWMTSADFKQILYISPAYERIWGRTVSSLLADPMSWIDAIAAEDRPLVFAALEGNGRGETYDIEYRILRPDGTQRWMRDRGFPVRDADGRVARVCGVVEDITARKQAEVELKKTHQELLGVSRQAGMAEIATSVLHNVGNVLNSVNTSLSVATAMADRSKAGSLSRVAGLVKEHAEDLPGFFANHPQGRRLPAFLTQFAGHMAAEQRRLLAELGSLRGNIEHINEIVAMQQNCAGSGGVIEVVPVADVIEDALRINAASCERHGAQVVREFEPAMPPIALDRNKLLMILVNLVRNARDACDAAGRTDKRITVQTRLDGQGAARILVKDNGIGIPPENLTRIFAHGFTTRKNGHGFGLHSSALAASGMGGSLHAHSEGRGLGATFIIDLPLLPSKS